MSDRQPHSAHFLTDIRNLWWNLEQLQHIARVFELQRVRHAVDVGCGQGHWTRTVARVLPAGADIVGVDGEGEWVKSAQSTQVVGDVSLSFQVGNAEHLPCADASIDLVTCQTLLIHVRDPRAVLAEMARVLKPGGVLLLAEPNNLSSIATAASPTLDIDDATAAFRLQATVERGKLLRGDGDNSLGETLLGLLDPSLFCDVRTWTNDRTRAVYPPHTPEMVRFIEDDRAQLNLGPTGEGRDETRALFLAGGGDDPSFPELWTRFQRLWATRVRALENGASSMSGGLFYVVGARRRAPSV